MGAEEKIAPEAAHAYCRRALQLPRREPEIRGREKRIHQQVPQEQGREESGPAHVDEVQVGMEIAPRGAHAANVEAAILVDDPAHGPVEFLSEAGIETGILHTY